MRKFIFGLVLASVAGPVMAKEQTIATPPVVTALADCQKIADGTMRLACYDKAAAALLGASARGDIRVVDRESVRKARRSLFGFALPSIPFFDSGDEKDAAPAKLDSTIVNFSSIGNGFYRFTIASEGAVWESTEGAYVRDAKAGEPITITRSRFGGYWAKIGNRRELRVRRIR